MYDQAEEVLKKYLKTDGKNKDFLVNLGFIYEQQGKPKKSEEYYEKAVKNLIPQSSDINSLAYKSGTSGNTDGRSAPTCADKSC